LQIGSKPGQSVYQNRQGKDTFLLLDLADCMLYLYVTVDTLLQPSAEAVAELQDTPYFWVKKTQMMYVLSEGNRCNFEHIQSKEEADDIIEDMEVAIAQV